MTDHATDLNGLFRGGWFSELEYDYSGILWVIIWASNKVIDIGVWSNCGGSQLGHSYCMYKYVNTHTHIYTHTHTHTHTRAIL